MKKPVLLLQFRTDKSLEHERLCITKDAGLDVKDLTIVNLLDNRYRIPQPEDLDKYSALITGASGQFNVTDWPKWVQDRVERIYPLFEDVVSRDFPMLCICFGHQLLAEVLGGKVEADKKQAETGIHEITVNRNGRSSLIFKNVPAKFQVVLGHKDSVTKLPKGAKLLASSQKCKIQAYQIKNNIFCIQFHAELNRDSLLWRLNMYPEYMKGRTLKEVKKTFKPIPHAEKIISNFVNLVKEREK